MANRGALSHSLNQSPITIGFQQPIATQRIDLVVVRRRGRGLAEHDRENVLELIRADFQRFDAAVGDRFGFLEIAAVVVDAVVVGEELVVDEVDLVGTVGQWVDVAAGGGSGCRCSRLVEEARQLGFDGQEEVAPVEFLVDLDDDR